MLARSTSDRAAVRYLQSRIIRNWFRRSMRSPFFWLIGVFILFLLIGTIASVIDGPEDSGLIGESEQRYVSAAAGVFLLGGILVGLWRGTTNTPGASLADVVLLMGSPVSARLQFALLMLRPSLLNAVIIGLWATAAGSGLILGSGDQWAIVRLLFTVMLVVLLSEFLRNAVWVGTEQLVARSLERGQRARMTVKAITLFSGGAVGIGLLWPLTRDFDGTWRDALLVLGERGAALAAYPPMSLMASVFTPGGYSLASALVLMAGTLGVGALAIFWARDFTEPVSMTAERKTDARGQILESGSDVHWAILSQYGISPQMRVAISPFGRGPWALLWGSLIRWMRYQIAAAWITLFIMVGFGLLTALGVRMGFVSDYLAWMVVLIFPFFGSVNQFLDELRRQFLFLIPGSAHKRLFAAAATSVLDGMISSLIVIAALLVFGAISPGEAGGLFVLATAISLLAQACLALVQIIVPFWTGQRMRVSLTFGLTGLAFVPAFVVLALLTVTAGPVIGLLVASGITGIAGLVMMVIAGWLFDRMEFAG